MQAYWSRILGGLIIIKVVLPFVLLAVLVVAPTVVFLQVNAALEAAWQEIEPGVKAARAQIDVIDNEARRLVGEARKIKDETTEFAEDVKEIVKPLKGALSGLSKSMGTIARTVQNVVNTIIRAVNGLPFVKIPRVRIKNYFKIPAFDIDLPNVDLQVSDQAYEAIRRLSEESYKVTTKVKSTLDILSGIFATGWRLAKVAFYLIIFWLILVVVGYAARSLHRFSQGWKMIRGQPVEGALMLL
ncbi:MAG: hypothetical protein ACE5H7_06135 [Acidiferrobacterales bacterium]